MFGRVTGSLKRMGTAAWRNASQTPTEGQIPVFDATGYPAGDASQLTNLALVPDASKAPPKMSNNSTDPAKDIDFTATYCRAENAAVKITTTAMTKRLDASWVAGTNQGGLSSSLHPLAAAVTTIHSFAVIIGGSADFLFDTDPDCANGIADHSVTAYRRCGSLKTNATPDFPPFHQIGDHFYLKGRVRDVNDSTPGTAANLAAMSTPGGIEVIGIFAATLIGNGGQYMVINSPDDTDTAASVSNHDLMCFLSAERGQTNLERKTNTSSQIRYRCSGTITSFYMWTLGWIDSRGRDA